MAGCVYSVSLTFILTSRVAFTVANHSYPGDETPHYNLIYIGKGGRYLQ